MADNPDHTHGKRTVSSRLLCALRVIYIIYSLLMIAYFALAFATPYDMSVTFLNFCLRQEFYLARLARLQNVLCVRAR